MDIIPKNTICLWFNRDAEDAAKFYASTFPDSKITNVFIDVSAIDNARRG